MISRRDFSIALAAFAATGASRAAAAGPPPNAAVRETFALFEDVKLAPPTPFLLEDGSLRTLRAFPGRPVVATFWATWCGACAIEMPRLARLSEEAPEIAVAALAVDRDESFRKVDRFYRRHRIRSLIPAIDQGQALARQFGVPATPSSVVIDGAGRIRAAAVGNVEWGDPGIRAYLRSLA